MKMMIASDIHGSAYYCDLLLKAFADEHADRLLLLGDILYHGPRNDLPRDYSPKQVIRQLSPLSDSIFCVRGNCDTEVDQMVLPFPIMADYALLTLGNRIMYATHGHIFHPEHLPPLRKGDILLFGHTHVPELRKAGGCLCLNPGSVSIPKEASCHSCIVLEEGSFLWKDIETGEYYRHYNADSAGLSEGGAGIP